MVVSKCFAGMVKRRREWWGWAGAVEFRPISSAISWHYYGASGTKLGCFGWPCLRMHRVSRCAAVDSFVNLRYLTAYHM